MEIQKLPDDAITKLLSGIIITDATQCVLELVYNSLDAKASTIAIRINLEACQIQVIDDGRGISRTDLENCGEKFMTSKYHDYINSDSSFITYGFKGQALSSIAEVSKVVKIETRTQKEESTLIKVFEKSKALPILKGNKDSGIGTKVTVEDFMWCMPVRRKRLNEIFDFEEIKLQLKYLAIVHHNVSFMFRNEVKGLIIFQTHGALNILESIANIFGGNLAKSLTRVNYQFKNYKISGYISLTSHFQCNIQLLYINKRILSKGMIHKVVNDIMNTYMKCRENSSEENPTLKNTLNFSNNVFILEIKCPFSYCDIFTNLRKCTVEFKSWKAVLKCFHKAMKKVFYTSNNISSHDSFKSVKNKITPKNINKKHGISQLINAVKGIPAKRKFVHKNRTEENNIVNNLSNSIFTEKNENNPNTNLSTTYKCLGNCFTDSLESPIPKKRLKGNPEEKLFNSDIISMTLNEEDTLNRSFFQFYKWLKKRIRTDVNALNFFNNFLQEKQKTKHVEYTKLNAMRKNKTSNKVYEGVRSERYTSNDLHTASVYKHRPDRRLPSKGMMRFQNENEMIISRRNIQNNINLFSVNSFGKKMNHFFEKKTYQHFENSTANNFVNLNDKMAECEYLKNNSSLAKNGRKYVELYDSDKSPAASEIFFSNFIKFRNLVDSFDCGSVDARRQYFTDEQFPPKYSKTWISHHGESACVDLTLDTSMTKNKVVSWMKTYVTNTLPPERSTAGGYEKYKNYLNAPSLGLDSPAGNMLMSEMSSKIIYKSIVESGSNRITSAVTIPFNKVDATVQTEDTQEIIKKSVATKTFLDPRGGHRETSIETFSRNQLSELESHQGSEKDRISLRKGECDILCSEISGYEQNTFIFSDDLINNSEPITGSPKIQKKAVLFEEPCRGQKFNETTRYLEGSSSSSKEVTTILADCLSEIQNTFENEPNLTKSHNDDAEAQSASLLKTIPNEELALGGSAVLPTFHLTERHDFVPKGLSPKFESTESDQIIIPPLYKRFRIKQTNESDENELSALLKWRDESCGGPTMSVIPDEILDEMRQKAEKNMINCENKILSASLSYCAIKVHNLLHSFTFTKELLSDVEIIGQLDKKFIVARMIIPSPKKMDLITLFDQHAVDERIRLENLMNEYVMSDGKFLSSSLNSAVECEIGETMVQVMSNYERQLLKFGLVCKPINKNTVSVETIPRYLAEKNAREKKNKKDTSSFASIVQSLIINVLEELIETRGASSQVPKIMFNLLCSDACHGAIKFNRALTTIEISELISKLKKCKLPFQCAHGRPSVVPLIDLEEFKKAESDEEIVKFEKLKGFADKKTR